MQVIVTGATGFLGSSVVPALRAVGHDVHCWQGDIAQAAESFHCLPSVVHLAANTRGSYATNVFGTASVVQQLEPGARIVFASSLESWRQRDQYERDKWLGEQLVRARPDTEAVVLRLGNVYGPGPQSRRGTLNRLLRQVVAGQAVTLYGDAFGVRDYVYVADVVQAIVQALDAPPGTYDVGTGTGTSLADALTLATRATTVTVTTQPPLHYTHASLALEGQWLPDWRPTVPLVDGIQRTLAWLQGHEVAAAGRGRPEEVLA